MAACVAPGSSAADARLIDRSGARHAPTAVKNDGHQKKGKRTIKDRMRCNCLDEKKKHVLDEAYEIICQGKVCSAFAFWL